MESQRRSACLATETLLELVEGRAGASTHRRVQAHAAECEACRELLSALADDATSLSPGASRAEQPATPTDTTVLRASDGPRGEDEPGERLQPGARLGRYVVLSLVGVGGMGVVYAAHDPELGRLVALKLLRPRLAGPRRELEDRLRREAQAMARLNHPNVATVHDVGWFGDRIFVAMEFIRGQTLAAWLRTPRSRRDIVALFVLAGRGLAAAHAAGLVHRDFKPENVLVGEDGHVRVVDFGLARQTGEPTATPGPGALDGAIELADLTVSGAVLGTPIYMAPEQHEGRPADARSDQFSFCVALYAALHGQRPFAGDTLRSLAAAVRSGRLAPAAAGASVPLHLRRALRRGLAVAPADRFPSMDALLAALTYSPGRRLGFAAAIAGVATLSAALVSARTPEPAEPCRDAERHLVGVWDDDRRAALAQALARTDAPYAADTTREVTAVFDAYAARWVAMRTEACRATAIHGEQTAELLDLRNACLDTGLRELGALADRLLAADRHTAELAVRAAHSLGDLERCADANALLTPVRPPADPPTRRRVDDLRARLAEARSYWYAGQYREGLGRARALVPEAQAIGYRPLEAEVLHLEGLLADELDDFAGAARSLEAAVWAAEASRHDEIAVQALIALIVVRGQRQSDFAEAQALARRTTAVLERLGDPPARTADLLYTRALLAIERSELDVAEADLLRARELIERRFGADDLRVVEPLLALGQIAVLLGDGERALPLFERALEIKRRGFGDDHPDVALIRECLAAAHQASRRHDAAEANYRQALAIYERAFGREHHQVATVLHNLALLQGWQGRYDEELANHRSAVALAERTMGADHPMTALFSESLAGALTRSGAHAEAEALLRRALASLRAKVGPDHQSIAATLFELGLVEIEVGRLDDARRSLGESDEMSRRVLGAAHSSVFVLRALGDIELRRDRPALAVPHLEAALAAHGPDDDPGVVAWTRALLARALYDAGRERARARALLGEAHAHIRGDERMVDEREELTRWMRSRGLDE